MESKQREREKKALVHAGIFFELGLPRWRESTLSAFMVLNAWHTKSFDITFFSFSFSFFLCVQLQHGTGESIIIDVIFFERGTCARELVILGTERVLVGGRGDIW